MDNVRLRLKRVIIRIVVVYICKVQCKSSSTGHDLQNVRHFIHRLPVNPKQTRGNFAVSMRPYEPNFLPTANEDFIHMASQSTGALWGNVLQSQIKRVIFRLGAPRLIMLISVRKRSGFWALVRDQASPGSTTVEAVSAETNPRSEV